VILRLAAAVVLALGLAALGLFLHIIGEAPWSDPRLRHLRAMKDRAGVPAAYAPFAVAEFRALPHDAPPATVAALERRGVAFTGYVQAMLPSTDGDFHFELAAIPRPTGSPDTTYITAEATPAFTRGSSGWAYERLATALRPNSGGETPWADGPRRARLSGWLCFDYQYDTEPVPHRRRARRVTGWEIHPLTRVEVWDDSLARFVDVPR
jgi:hypothetical protein